MELKIYLQIPKPRKKPLVGALNISKGTAEIYDDDGKGYCIAELKSVEIVSWAKEGFLLRGFEYAGMDRQHREKFVYQEWYCVFPQQKTKEK